MFCVRGLIFGGFVGVGSRFHLLRYRTHFRRYRGRRLSFSCFTLPYSFSAVSRASCLIFMFWAPGLVFIGDEASAPDFIFCATALVFASIKGDGSRFHVLFSRIHFRRYRVRRVPFSFFTLSHSFPAVPRTSGPVFMFCAPGHIFGGSECVGSRFHVLRARTRFRRYRGRRVPIFFFFAPGLIFGGIDGVWSCFHVLRSQTHFRQYRGRRDPFSALLRATGPVFNGIVVVGSHFHVFRCRTRFRRHREWRIPFSCFALPNSFSTVLGATCPVSCFALPNSFSAVSNVSGPIFMFSAPGLVLGGTEGVDSRFHVLRTRAHFRRYRGRLVSSSCFAPPGLIFGVTEGVGSHFHFLRARNHVWRFRGLPVSFSCFACPNSFLAVPTASVPSFMF
jgi:hypothetical protein